jgi:hypothetical protein
MKNFRLSVFAIFALVLLPLFSCDNDEIVTGTMTDEFITVPFRGIYQINANLTDQSEKSLFFEVKGEGDADVFGESLMFSNAEIQVNYELPDWNQFGNISFICNMGDEVSGSFTGLFRHAWGQEPPKGHGNFTFTQGSGRYEGITGYGNYILTMSENQTGTMEWSGYINVRKAVLTTADLNLGIQ